MQIGGSGDKQADLIVKLAGWPWDQYGIVQCRTRSDPKSSGLLQQHTENFGDVVFVMYNPCTSTLFTAIGADLEIGSAGVFNPDSNIKHRETYDDSAQSEHTALTNTTKRIIALLPRSKMYNWDKPDLSPTHQVEFEGTRILRAIIASHMQINIVPNPIQNSLFDLTIADQKFQLKCTSSRFDCSRDLYCFGTKHTRAGVPYSVDDGLAFAFVTTDCKTHAYILSADDANRMDFLRSGTCAGRTALYLPRPDLCPISSPYRAFVFPRLH